MQLLWCKSLIDAAAFRGRSLLSVISREIIGFSVRPHPDLFSRNDAKLTCPFLSGPELKFFQPLSLSFHVWDAATDTTLEKEVNGTNLLYLPDTFGCSKVSPKNCCLLAVDLASDRIEDAMKRYDVFPLALGVVGSSKYWKFLGYDIVSLGGLNSGLYGYSWRDDLRIKAPAATRNVYGLIPNLPFAIPFESFFDSQVASHAPFMAAGVWLKYRTDDCQLVDI